MAHPRARDLRTEKSFATIATENSDWSRGRNYSSWLNMFNASSQSEYIKSPNAHHSARHPDLSFIKQHIPISEVARELDLRVTGNAARCWRPDAHRHGDRTPSVSFNKKKNRGRCFVCDDHDWSNVDLVAQVLNCRLSEAIRWIADRFPVPDIPKGKHLRSAERWGSRERVGTSGFMLEDLVRSGFWSMLTKSERAVLVVLCCFAEPNSGAVTISYRGIMRFAGIGSYTTVSRVLGQFAKLSLMHVRKATDADGLRACNSYVLTFDHPVFLNILSDVHQRHQEEIQAERELRGERRKANRAARAHTKVTPVYNQCSVIQISAPT